MRPSEDEIENIARLMELHGVSLADIAQALESRGEKDARSHSGDVAAKVFAYLGGIFVLAGISVYIAMFWDDMNSATRTVMTLGAGLITFVLALASLRSPSYQRSVTPLLVVSAILQPTGWFVLLYEYFHRGTNAENAVLFVCSLMALQHGAASRRFRDRAFLLFVTLLFGYAALLTFFDIFEADPRIIGLSLGISMACIRHALSDSAHARLSGPLFFIGSCLFYGALFDWLHKTPLEVAFLAASCAVVFLSTVVKSRALLFVSAVSMIFYIGYFTHEHFVDSTGWPAALIVVGAAFFGIGGFALKIGREFSRG